MWLDETRTLLLVWCNLRSRWQAPGCALWAFLLPPWNPELLETWKKLNVVAVSLARTTVWAGGFCVMGYHWFSTCFSVFVDLLDLWVRLLKSPCPLHPPMNWDPSTKARMALVTGRSTSKASPEASAPSVMGSQAGRLERNGRRGYPPSSYPISSLPPEQAPDWRGWKGLPFPILSQLCRSFEVMWIIKSKVPSKGRWVRS